MSDHLDLPGVYIPTDDPSVYESTALANAGWYDEGQHGGAFASLIVGHVESVPTLTPMEVSRVTVEMFRVVPLVPLKIETRIVREGKRIQMVGAEVFDPDGTMLATALVQRLRTDDLPIPEGSRPLGRDFAAADDYESVKPETWGVGSSGKVLFHRNAVEVREVDGGFSVPGPGTAWFRITLPLIAGRENTPAQLAAAVADFGNGVSSVLNTTEWVFMNPDLTVHLTRYPIGEWVALSARSSHGDKGRGLATGDLWDEQGWIGRSTQSLYIDLVR